MHENSVQSDLISRGLESTTLLFSAGGSAIASNEIFLESIRFSLFWAGDNAAA